MPKDAPQTNLSAVQQPVATAQGLSNAHYVDPALFEEEKTAVLLSGWTGLAAASEVPEPGDAKPLTFLGIPLLLIRDKEGAVRVFENTCRHRGMILVEKARKIDGVIRCPYHSWCYSTKGDLVATPHVGGPGQSVHPAIKKSELGLNEIKSHIWFDTVFVNIDGTAPPFKEVHAELLARWDVTNQPQYHGGPDSTFTLNVQTNWKLAVENYCESYHLPWVHPGLNSYSRLEDHYNIVSKGRYSGQGTLVYSQLTNDQGATFPDFADLPDTLLNGGEYIAVYPNVLLGIQRDHWFSIVLEPISTNETREHIHLYYASSDTDDALRAKNAKLWKTVFEEDIFVVEGMQKGRQAPNFDGGRFSPAMDAPTHCFHEWMASKLQHHRQQE